MTEPMRVTIVLSTSSGGVGSHVRSVAERLPALGMRTRIVAPAETGERFGFAEIAPFTPVEIATRPRPRYDVLAVRLLRRLLADTDVVHAHGFRAAALSGLALGRRRPGRTPLVATWHNAVLGGGPRRALLTGLERLAARRADLTLGVSSDLVRRARALGAPDTGLAAIAAPAMPPATRPREDVRAELGADGRPLVLAVGRLAEQKDYDTLLAAAAHWTRQDPRPLVVVAGDGPEMARLRRDAEDARVDVRFLGRRDDVPDLLSAADVYVITSLWEGCPLVVQEAMRAGLPVVATAVGGIPDLVGDDAVLVPARDADAVAAGVRDLVASAERRRELGERGRQRSGSWPDEDDAAAQLAAIYSDLAPVTRH